MASVWFSTKAVKSMQKYPKPSFFKVAIKAPLVTKASPVV